MSSESEKTHQEITRKSEGTLNEFFALLLEIDMQLNSNKQKTDEYEK